MSNEHFTDEQWFAFQRIPEQGYSHRAWLNDHIEAIVQRAVNAALTDAADAIEEFVLASDDRSDMQMNAGLQLAQMTVRARRT